MLQNKGHMGLTPIFSSDSDKNFFYQDLVETNIMKEVFKSDRIKLKYDYKKFDFQKKQIRSKNKCRRSTSLRKPLQCPLRCEPRGDLAVCEDVELAPNLTTEGVLKVQAIARARPQRTGPGYED